MTRMTLLAVGPGQTLGPEQADIAIVREGALAAALWRDGQGLAAPKDKKRFGKALVAFQQRLETLQASGPLIAAAPGGLVHGEAEARAMLQANAAALEAALADIGGARQFQITIAWDLGAALMRFAEAPEVRAARTSVNPGDRLALGRALQSGMEAVRRRLAESYRGALAAAARDLVDLPAIDETTLINVAAMIDASDAQALERAVEAIDATWPDGLKIKFVGPLPAISFAALHLDRPSAEDVRSARARLGLVEGAGLEDIRQAFRAAAKTLHPDRGGTAEAAEAAVAARDLLVRVAAAHLGLGPAAPAPLVGLRREGDAEAAA